VTQSQGKDAMPTPPRMGALAKLTLPSRKLFVAAFTYRATRSHAPTAKSHPHLRYIKPVEKTRKPQRIDRNRLSIGLEINGGRGGQVSAGTVKVFASAQENVRAVVGLAQLNPTPRLRNTLIVVLRYQTVKVLRDFAEHEIFTTETKEYTEKRLSFFQKLEILGPLCPLWSITRRARW